MDVRDNKKIQNQGVLAILLKNRNVNNVEHNNNDKQSIRH